MDTAERDDADLALDAAERTAGHFTWTLPSRPPPSERPAADTRSAAGLCSPSKPQLATKTPPTGGRRPRRFYLPHQCAKLHISALDGSPYSKPAPRLLARAMSPSAAPERCRYAGCRRPAS
jgi:hypothetical protein